MERAVDFLGRNVESESVPALIIHLLRHAKKESGNGGLSQEGEKQAINKGVELGKIKAVKFYRGESPRVTRTVDLIGENVNSENQLATRNRWVLSAGAISLDFQKSTYFIRVRRNLEAAFAVSGRGREEAIRRAETKNIQEWLDYGEHKPDPFTSSPQEVAEGMAMLLWRQIRMSKYTDKDSDVVLFDVTHEFMLAAFIQYFLLQKRGDSYVGGDVIMNEMGNIPYLCDIEIKVFINRGERKILATIGDNEYLVDEERIADFASRYFSKRRNVSE